MDSVLQIQGRAGERQMRSPAEAGVSGAFPDNNYSVVWGASAD